MSVPDRVRAFRDEHRAEGPMRRPRRGLGILYEPMMRVLRRHHTRHHDLSRMGRYDFDITFPFCDWLFGTLYRPARAPESARRRTAEA